jgi:hypothetical protein
MKKILFVFWFSLMATACSLSKPAETPVPTPTVFAIEEDVEMPECNGSRTKEYLGKENNIWITFASEWKLYLSDSEALMKKDQTSWKESVNKVLGPRMLMGMFLESKCEELSVPYPFWEKEHSLACETISSYTLMLSTTIMGKSDLANQYYDEMIEKWDEHTAETVKIFQHCNWEIPEEAITPTPNP